MQICRNLPATGVSVGFEQTLCFVHQQRRCGLRSDAFAHAHDTIQYMLQHGVYLVSFCVQQNDAEVDNDDSDDDDQTEWNAKQIYLL